MEKRIMMAVVVVVLMFSALTGCGKMDDKHAAVTLTTASGQAYVWMSYNGTGTTINGQEVASRNRNDFTLKRGDSALVTFECQECGNKQEYEVSEAWARIISCDCPEKIDEKGNVKEYVSISISFEE